jgi:hypothetical protein
MKRTLLLLTLVLLAVGCLRVHVKEVKVNQTGNSKVIDLEINKTQLIAPAFYVPPYQELRIDCGDQPCYAGFNNSSNYYDSRFITGKFFILIHTTYSEADNYSQPVGDWNYVTITLSPRAFKDTANARLTISPLDDDLKKNYIHLETKNTITGAGVGKTIATVLLILFVIVGIPIIILKIAGVDLRGLSTYSLSEGISRIWAAFTQTPPIAPPEQAERVEQTAQAEPVIEPQPTEPISELDEEVLNRIRERLRRNANTE